MDLPVFVRELADDFALITRIVVFSSFIYCKESLNPILILVVSAGSIQIILNNVLCEKIPKTQTFWRKNFPKKGGGDRY